MVRVIQAEALGDAWVEQNVGQLCYQVERNHQDVTALQPGIEELTWRAMFGH